MKAGKRWQFSTRSLLVVMLVAGPLAGALAGTFGRLVQIVAGQLAFALLLIAVELIVLLAVFVPMGLLSLGPLWLISRYLSHRGEIPGGSGVAGWTRNDSREDPA
jgi:hypothetical protein